VEATEPPERFEFGFCPPLGRAVSRLTNPPAGSRWWFNEYIRSQDVTKEDGDFRVEEE
jgi:hypothetical protein